MAKKEKTVLLSLKKSTTKKTPQASCGHAIFGHAAFLVIVSGIAALCGVNHALSHHNVLLQSVVSSIFCISAGLLYGIFMIISRLLSLILSYAEKRSIVTSHYYSDLSYDCNKNKDGNDNERRLLDSSDDDDEEEEEQQYIFIHGKRRQVVHHYNSKKMLSRSVVISSMYLGGSGAYLAIPPLCMWDPTVSASFIFCIVILSMVDGGKIISEFKSNIDTGQTITNLRITRLMIHVAIMVTICLVILLDSNEEITRYYSIIVSTTTTTTHHGNHSGGSSSEIIHSENHDGGIGIFIRWPLIILAASSPILLRAGGGGVGPFTHSLPPSQTMETGLPVSILLSILVICWYSPLESPLLKQLTDVGTLAPMFILCPLLISGALVFVLRGFKNRSCSYTSIILTCILVVRQQITRKLKDKLDWVTLSLCIFSVTLTIFFIVYKKNVSETAEVVVVSKKKPSPFYYDDDDDDMEKAATKNSKSVAGQNSVSYEQEFNDDLNNDDNDDDDDGNDKRKGEQKT